MLVLHLPNHHCIGFLDTMHNKKFDVGHLLRKQISSIHSYIASYSMLWTLIFTCLLEALILQCRKVNEIVVQE